MLNDSPDPVNNMYPPTVSKEVAINALAVIDMVDYNNLVCLMMMK
jgi:hypothetical protein